MLCYSELQADMLVTASFAFSVTQAAYLVGASIYTSVVTGQEEPSSSHLQALLLQHA